MVATLFLLSCTWAPAQPPDGPAVSPPLREAAEGIPVPRLSRAMELLYRGDFTEDSTSGGVQFSRAYRLETRVLVLETTPRGAEVAFLTSLRLRNAQGAHGEEVPASIRLEIAQVDAQGRVIADKGKALAIPLEGPPPVECGAFVEMPHHRPRPGQPWDVTEDGRPARTWQVAGTEMVNGTSCLKLVGVQQSDDWDRPRADRTAWRRQDTVWLSPRLGVAYRVEREVLRREPARDEPHHRALLRYELDYNLPYTPQLFDDCVDEIYKSRSFLDMAAPWLANPGRYGPQLEAHLARINYYLESHPAHTPYREALLQVKRRVEAARRGESPPAPAPDESDVTPAAPAVATLGEAAPDFLATDFTRKQGTRLRAWQGKPVVLVFYSPTSFQAEELLRYAQQLADRHKDEIAVLGLAMTDDAGHVLHQRDTLQLTFPLLDGTGLRAGYDVKETPKVMVLDAGGIVCGSWVGWGQEVPGAVALELKRCLSRRKP